MYVTIHVVVSFYKAESQWLSAQLQPTNKGYNSFDVIIKFHTSRGEGANLDYQFRDPRCEPVTSWLNMLPYASTLSNPPK